MRLNRIKINNFRNFKELDVSLGNCAVIMGENRVGKSNLLYALRLVLDPTLSDGNRQLSENDFWDGLKPLKGSENITITVQLTDFEDDDDLLAVLADHLVQPEPMVAELTYAFVKTPPLPDRAEEETGYEFICYGGGRADNRFSYDVRKHIPIEVLNALRDVESDLSSWRRSPLRPLIERVQKIIDKKEVEAIAEEVDKVSSKISELSDLSNLCKRLNTSLEAMAGSAQALETSLGLSPADPEKLLRSLRLYIDGNARDVSEASLGSANVLYLTLRSLELNDLVAEGTRQHTFYAIEEPEAHLHPQLQRMVYRSFLKERNAPDDNGKTPVSYLLTTHSSHIASVAPVDSFVLLKKSEDGSSVGVSAADIELEDADKDDIERYLDVTRAEALFAKGIIFVEGDAERFLIPLLAKRAGYDLDALGIVLCSVSGTNFTPYVKFFGPKGLNIPMAILTDLDPYDSKGTLKRYSDTRVMNIKDALGILPPMPPASPASPESVGIFLNSHTFEIDLYNQGAIYQMNETIQELCTVKTAKERFKELSYKIQTNGNKIIPLEDPKKFLKDIEYVGKGRFAQRLAWHISQCDKKFQLCPDYILKGIKYVRSRVN